MRLRVLPSCGFTETKAATGLFTSSVRSGTFQVRVPPQQSGTVEANAKPARPALCSLAKTQLGYCFGQLSRIFLVGVSAPTGMTNRDMRACGLISFLTPPAWRGYF